MGTIELNMLDSINKPLLEKVAFIEAELAKLKSEVERLLKFRELLGNELLAAERELVDSATIRVANNANEIVEDFEETAFKGEKVKNAVNAVRSLFFDDASEAFQDFACISVEQRCFEHCVGLEFVFESLKDSNRAFAVFLPVSLAKSNLELGLNEDMTADIHMCLSIKLGREPKNCIFLPKFRTLKYVEMAEAIKSYVNGEVDNDFGKELCDYVKSTIGTRQ